MAIKKQLIFVFILAIIVVTVYMWDQNRGGDVIGGERDSHGCLIAGGYSWDEYVGACVREFEFTQDIKRAAKIAVDNVGRAYGLTVVSFNSYEEPGAYDIMLERGSQRDKQTVYIKEWKVSDVK